MMTYGNVCRASLTKTGRASNCAIGTTSTELSTERPHCAVCQRCSAHAPHGREVYLLALAGRVRGVQARDRFAFTVHLARLTPSPSCIVASLSGTR